MSDVPKVYWTVYNTRSAAHFLVVQKGRTQEAYKQDSQFIKGLRHDSSRFIGLPIKPQIYLCKGKLTDFAYDNVGSLTINQKVVDTFGGELEEYGELYPVDFAEEPYYLYRVTRMVEAMDIEKIAQSDYRYKGKKNYDWQVSRYAYEFIPENISGLLLFKDINRIPPRSVYFGQRFIDIVKRHKLTGLHKDTFKPIWPCPEKLLAEKTRLWRLLISTVNEHLACLPPELKYHGDLNQLLGYLPPDIEAKILHCQDVQRMEEAYQQVSLGFRQGAGEYDLLTHQQILEKFKDL